LFAGYLRTPAMPEKPFTVLMQERMITRLRARAKRNGIAACREAERVIVESFRPDYIPTDDELDAFIGRHNFDMDRREAKTIVDDARSMHMLNKKEAR
jgi:hypothetical protein